MRKRESKFRLIFIFLIFNSEKQTLQTVTGNNLLREKKKIETKCIFCSNRAEVVSFRIIYIYLNKTSIRIRTI